MGGGNHSWKDARDSYFNALTATDTAQRQQHYTDTFQSLGNLIHLVQDASSPAHSRNDLHFSLWGIGDTDRLHVWGNEQGLTAAGASGSLRYDPSILELPSNNFAPIPIARIIDTEKLKAGIPSEGLDIGIAEYSNANFFSDDTIFDSNYQAPTDLGLITEPGPNLKPTQYLYRHPGAPVGTRYKLAVASSLADSVTLPFGQQQWALDDLVMASYAEKLFPRAIGYSAGLIDYFFRNALSGFVWGPVTCAGFDPSRNSDYYIMHVPVEWFPDGYSPNELHEQGGTGRFVAIVQYQRGGQILYQKVVDTVNTFQPINHRPELHPSIQLVEGGGSNYSFLQAGTYSYDLFLCIVVRLAKTLMR